MEAAASPTPSARPADPFLDFLASLCRNHPTRSKWVFVPSHALGRTIGERLALSGTNWLNLRFVTPLDIALRMGAPFLVERGIEPSEEGLGPALAMRLMLEQGEVGDERGSCRRTAPPVLGAQSVCHGSGACAAGGAAPSGATRFDAPSEGRHSAALRTSRRWRRPCGPHCAS